MAVLLPGATVPPRNSFVDPPRTSATDSPPASRASLPHDARRTHQALRRWLEAHRSPRAGGKMAAALCSQSSTLTPGRPRRHWEPRPPQRDTRVALIHRDARRPALDSRFASLGAHPVLRGRARQDEDATELKESACSHPPAPRKSA